MGQKAHAWRKNLGGQKAHACKKKPTKPKSLYLDQTHMGEILCLEKAHMTKITHTRSVKQANLVRLDLAYFGS